MTLHLLRSPRRRIRRSTRTRLGHLRDLVGAVREETRGRDHAGELNVLLIYVKCDPPADRLAAELGVSRDDAERLLRRAYYLLRGDEPFRDAFHRINSRLE